MLHYHRLKLIGYTMNKFALVALTSSFLVLTACAKQVTEVKKGESKIEAKIQTAPLSSNKKQDIEADIAAIEHYGQSQEALAAPLQQKLTEAMQQEDQTQLKALFPQFRQFVENSNQLLKQIPLKSSEVDKLREKMIENSVLGLQLSEIVLNSSLENPDPTKLEPLQQKAMQLQAELMTISQDIQQKIAEQPAAPTPAPTASTPTPPVS